MNPSFFESLERSRLGVGQPRLDAAFRKNPPSFAGLYQQEFDYATAHPVANRCHLFAFLQLAQFRQPDKFRRERQVPNLRPTVIRDPHADNSLQQIA